MTTGDAGRSFWGRHATHLRRARPLRLLSPVLEEDEGRADYVPTPVAARATVAGVDPRALVHSMDFSIL